MCNKRSHSWCNKPIIIPWKPFSHFTLSIYEMSDFVFFNCSNGITVHFFRKSEGECKPLKKILHIFSILMVFCICRNLDIARNNYAILVTSVTDSLILGKQFVFWKYFPWRKLSLTHQKDDDSNKFLKRTLRYAHYLWLSA